MPTNLTAKITPAGQVELSWAASANATGYHAKWATADGGPYLSVTNVSGLAFTNAGLTSGTLYYFVVSATNGFGESGNSVQVSARPVSTASPRFTVGVSSSQLNLGWPADHTGWRLQTQTNSTGGGLGTNWVDVTGADSTNQITVPISLANGSAFFRLVFP
jgi:cellulose 1,4-beta-cellobiosidase